MASSLHDGKKDWSAIIVGGGPVGLLLGCLLGQLGLRTLILERRARLPEHSMAIGITPPSLKLFASLGLDLELIRLGIPIRDCYVHGEKGLLGCASFRFLPGSYPFILALPQQIHMGLLEQRLQQYPNVTLLRNAEVTALNEDQASGSVEVTWRIEDKTETASASWVMGCDGLRSTVRTLAGIPISEGSYGCHFVMGDFTDRSDLGEAAHLYFTSDGAVESFPLPDGKRRWIVQTLAPGHHNSDQTITPLVERRTGRVLLAEDQLNQSFFSPHWMEAASYHQGRIILCGDAAHVMSPIGGQGMNTGWADAEFAAALLTEVEQKGKPAQPLLEAYDYYRKKAARAATRRAHQGMWLGTRRGKLAAVLRDMGMRHLLFKGPLARHVGPHFSMVTLPYHSLDQVPLFRNS